MCRVTDSLLSPPVSPCDRSKPLLVMRDQQHDNNSRKRRVRFGTNVRHVFEKEITVADHPRLWYTGDEYVAIKNSIFSMLRSIQNGCGGDEDGFIWRGFEHVQQRRPRKAIRRKHVEDLIYWQKNMGIVDAHDLGLLAASNSRDSSQRARDLAILDEMEASAIYNEEDETVPDVESISESESDEEELHLDGLSPATLNISRSGDDKMVHLLRDMPMQSLPVSRQDETALSLLDLPYKLALLIFPCIC